MHKKEVRYDIKNIKCGRRGVRVQLSARGQTKETINLIQIAKTQVIIYEPHGNYKSEIYDKYTKTYEKETQK